METATQKEIAIEGQVKNDAGGFVFKITPWQRLDRFLILGSDKSQYISGRGRALSSAGALEDCVKEDGVRVVNRILEISKEGRALQNSPAVFALAYCMKKGNLTTRRTASAVMHQVCRNGTHLFEFVNACTKFGGRGRIWHRTIQNWYNNKSAKNLGYQLMKYQSRDGISHRVLLKLARPTPASDAHNQLYGWSVNGWENGVPSHPIEDPALARVLAFENCKALPKEEKDKAISLIHEYDLPRECVPTWLRNDPEVQMGLLNKMPMTAMIRNLASMTASGMLEKYPKAVDMICKRLVDEDRLKNARVHPMNLLNSLKIYGQGKGSKGNLTWRPVPAIMTALESAFYLAFKHVEPTNKRICLAIDVSGSMTQKASNLQMSCLEAEAALTLVSVNTEPNTEVIAFTHGGRGMGYGRYGASSKWAWEDQRFGVAGLDINPKDKIAEVVDSINRFPHSGTDCSAPICWAYTNDKKFDLFVVYTDNETWAGKIHPYEALRQYRAKMGIPARLIVVAMTNSPFSIADPNDSGMLDIVGCDSATPKLISDFAVGRI